MAIVDVWLVDTQKLGNVFPRVFQNYTALLQDEHTPCYTLMCAQNKQDSVSLWHPQITETAFQPL